ncbi:protein FAR-RED IMPAIRED RESPONSE 1-like [Salvia splendens]|uniref:protein FAR-RED IMPAIRED RESPONSE 1-like n=1 Tax=Salvia splendens TaxID=180675 RepID=UPI001C2667E7|nr:protein FAR-RED IMPAIRED RESPONSE 1-like [Salvia splendens]
MWMNARVAFKFDSDRGYVIKHLNEEHNHPMVLIQHQKFMRLNRQLDPVHQKFITDCVGANIGPSLTFKLLTELMGGYESVGCTMMDIRNYTRDIRRYAEGYDAQMIIEEMKKKKENCDAFTWCMWHIMEKLAEKVPKSLLGNSEFKKDLNSCVWSELIEPTEFEDKWKTVMETYELEGAEWDFPNSSLIKTTSVTESQNNFFKRYTQSRANLVVFLMNFNNVVDAQRNHSAKLDYMDSNTTAKMKTEWSFEKHASTIFTDGAFKEIQEQILEAYNHCNLVSISNDSSPEVYKVLDLFQTHGLSHSLWRILCVNVVVRCFLGLVLYAATSSLC